jgi:hypothetical protein
VSQALYACRVDGSFSTSAAARQSANTWARQCPGSVNWSGAGTSESSSAYMALTTLRTSSLSEVRPAAIASRPASPSATERLLSLSAEMTAMTTMRPGSRVRRSHCPREVGALCLHGDPRDQHMLTSGALSGNTWPGWVHALSRAALRSTWTSRNNII